MKCAIENCRKQAVGILLTYDLYNAGLLRTQEKVRKVYFLCKKHLDAQ